MRRARDLKDAKDRESAELVARTLVPMVIRIPARSGSGGRLFGSVTSADVVDAVAEQAKVVPSTAGDCTSTSPSSRSDSTRFRSSCTPMWSFE